MNLTDMRVIVRRDLHDEDAANYRWTNDELDSHIAHTLKELSEVLPLEQKALKLHLYLLDYPVGKLEVELSRIEEQKKQLIREINRIEQQIRELRHAIVNKEGVKLFCEVAASSLDNMDDRRWRLFPEVMNPRVFVSDKSMVKVTVPVAKKSEDAIALCTSRSGGR